VGQVAAELGRLYRHARWGEIPVADASRLATILAVMRQCLEASELERRIAEDGSCSNGGRVEIVSAMNLERRLEKVKALANARDNGNVPWLYYELHKWAEGCPVAFDDGEADAGLARYAPLALDALVAAGKIREQDRDRVTFIVRTLVRPPVSLDIPRNEVEITKALQ